MKLLAHLTEVEGKRIEQLLSEHCEKTAEYAAESLKNSNLYYCAYVAGMLHDMGKATNAFNIYLEKAYSGEKVVRGSVNHTFAGVIWLFEKYHNDSSTKWEKLTCEVLGYALGAHHSMFDCTDLDGKNGFLHRLKKEKDEIFYEEAVQNYFIHVISENKIDEFFHIAVCEVQKLFENLERKYGRYDQIWFQVSILTRMILSAVVYGDRRDTSEFMSQKSLIAKQSISWTKQKKFFENKIDKFDTSTELNRVRNDISKQCVDFSGRESGIYRLNVPTGAGKTLSTLRYTLWHAEKYNKKRIIFVIPLLSVLEQNARVIQEFIADDNLILEHHSNVIHTKNSKEELDEYDLLCTSWDSPIVITTLVQLLDVLFSDKLSAASRMQALNNSIIVIDEIQSLPKKTTLMFNMAMNFLQQVCNATIVLSSATQPCFETLRWPLCLAKEPDMVHLDKTKLEVFERSEIVNCVNSYGMDWDECTHFCEELIEQNEAILVICNTKAESKKLYEKLSALETSFEGDIFHLSTSMCQMHRMDRLEQLQERLGALQDDMKRGKKVRKVICVSTQLVEAGVDFSFQTVVRILAGIDNLAQAAGRCNRSNEYGAKGKVYLINLKNENLSMLKDIAIAQKSTRKVLTCKNNFSQNSLIGEDAARCFYRYMYESTQEEINYPIKDYGNVLYLTDLLANKNDSARNCENSKYILHQPFATVGQKFKVFDDKTIDVLVPYGEGKALIMELKDNESLTFDIRALKNIMKEVKKYSISLYKWQKDKLDYAGLLHYLHEGRILVLDAKAYSEEVGLIDIEEQPVENFIM